MFFISSDRLSYWNKWPGGLTQTMYERANSLFFIIKGECLKFCCSVLVCVRETCSSMFLDRTYDTGIRYRRGTKKSKINLGYGCPSMWHTIRMYHVLLSFDQTSVFTYHMHTPMDHNLCHKSYGLLIVLVMSIIFL